MQTFTTRRLPSLLGGMLFLTAAAARAEVNMKDASFTKTWTDLPRLERTYNSRSLHQGLFGFGWCTDFEKSLDLSLEKQIVVKDCRASADITYRAVISPLSSPEMVFYRAENGETILRSKGRYIRSLPDKRIQIFNQRGQLISLREKENIDLSYDDTGNLRKIDFAKKYILRIHYDTSPDKNQRAPRIKEVESSQQTKATYRYYRDNLQEVRNAWKSKYTFTYDELQNLTRIDYPDKTTEKITYDQDKDWVLTYQDRQNCQENYSYRHDETPSGRRPTAASIEQDQVDHSTSQIKRQCQNQAPENAQIEFWHKTQKGRTYLERVRITRGTFVTETTFDPVSGAPRKVSSPGKLSRTATREASEN